LTPADAYRMTAEDLLARQASVRPAATARIWPSKTAVSAQFAVEIPVFAKPIFERLRRTRHTAHYFDPSAAPITVQE
jgi:hypothetical protein